jgi:hypothetical protein
VSELPVTVLGMMFANDRQVVAFANTVSVRFKAASPRKPSSL